MRTKAERIADDVERMHRKGMGRNEIARELGVAQGTVTKAASLRGVEFDRAQTVEATEAFIADARASRASLSLRALAASHAALDHFNKTLAAGEYGDARNLMTAFGIASDKHLVLDQHVQAARNLSAVDEWTAAMLGRTEAEKAATVDMSDEDIAADVAAMMADARPPTAIEGTP